MVRMASTKAEAGAGVRHPRRRRLLRVVGLVLLVVLLAAVAAGLWMREEVARLWAVNTLFDEDRVVANFSAMDAAFLTAPVPRGSGPVSPLPAGPPATLPQAAQDWVVAHDVTAIVVLHDGQIVYEDYRLATGPGDLRISWSMAKSFLSALLGVLLEEGAIESLDAPVTRYAPNLAGSAYDGATIRDVLTMSSGVVFDEDYDDPGSDINRMGRALALGRSMDAFAADLDETFAAPGEVWQYVSIDTHVLGMVIRGATGRSVPELMSEKIVAPMGLEKTPYYLTDGEGVAFALAGLNMTTRDYARFGQMFLQEGRLNGRQIVPRDWVERSTAPAWDAGDVDYGFQWWVPADAAAGEFLAEGLYGQFIYVDRPLGVVVAVNAADPASTAPGYTVEAIEVFRGIARAVSAP